MADRHYEEARLAEIYDLASPWSPDREFYLDLAGPEPQQVLDLGCGTGLLCRAYAERGHKVMGVDPAAPMLAVARRAPYGKDIDWVQTAAQAFRSERRFDLIIMTGHAFQVLLTDTDVLTALAAMREHLKPGGRIVFETRNPAYDWAAEWDFERTLALSDGAVTIARRLIGWEADRLRFELRYRFPGETLVSESVIRFMPRAHIEACIGAAALSVDDLLGDWDGSPFAADRSPEMIFKLSRAA